MFFLPQSDKRNVIDSSYHNVQFLVGKYFDVEQKYIKHLHILSHAEYMEKFTTISISPSHLIEVSRTITIWVVLYKNSDISKLSMQHGIKDLF